MVGECPRYSGIRNNQCMQRHSMYISQVTTDWTVQQDAENVKMTQIYSNRFSKHFKTPMPWKVKSKEKKTLH